MCSVFVCGIDVFAAMVGIGRVSVVVDDGSTESNGSTGATGTADAASNGADTISPASGDTFDVPDNSTHSKQIELETSLNRID